MKKFLLSLSLMVSALFASAQDATFWDATDIDDLALIYIGAQHRPDWNKKLFEPYVMHKYSDGTQSWNFDGFLMIEFMRWNKYGQTITLGEYNGNGEPAKEDWEALLDEQLGTYTGNGCRALDDLIGELIPVLGEPGHKHRVVLSIPVPLNNSTKWGSVAGNKLYFTSINDKCTAMQWYVDLVIQKWNAANFKNLKLDGMYWTTESFWGTMGDLVKRMNAYYHSKKLNTYWIPYFKASGRDQWAQWDIDQAYIQPNYYFGDAPYSNLPESVEAAFTYTSGLEIEFEGKNFTYTPDENDPSTGTRSWYWYIKAGMYGRSKDFYQRLIDYLDAYENATIDGTEVNAFDYLPIAYYSGFQGVYDFMSTGNRKDKELMDRMSTIINKRHQYTGWDVAPRKVSGIGETLVTGDSKAYGVEGGIYIANDSAKDIKIYSLDGKLIAAPVAEELHFGNVVSCPAGIYIVKIDQNAIKVAVK